jgi:hypothetical protein
MRFHAHAVFNRACIFYCGGAFLVLMFFCLCFLSCGAATSTSTNPQPTPAPTPTPGTPAITSPSSGASVLSPLMFTGSVAGVPNVDHSQLFLDNTSSIYYGGALPMKNKWMFVPDGQHTLTLTAYDKNNNALASTSANVDVSGQTSPAALPELQSIPAWQFCSQDLAGSECASGLGVATSTQTQNVATPSLSGASTQFSLGGAQAYSNALWWISLGGGTLLSNFTYALDFYIDNADAPEALEFDVNQSFGGNRYTYGTECSYKNTHHWDVWNPLAEAWVPSSVPCPPVASNQWHHLQWQFQRVNNQVHYISITLDGTATPVNMYFNLEPNWKPEDIDIAFQMDGDYKQTPYNVWLDNVTLTASY